MKLSAAMALMVLAAGTATAQTTSVEWMTLGNGKTADGRAAYIQRFVITGDTDFDALAFNQFARRMRPVSPDDRVVELVPGYYRLESGKFGHGADTVVVDIETYGSLSSVCYAPDGVHTLRDGVPSAAQYTIANITARPELWVTASGTDRMPYGDAVYDHNESVSPEAIGFYDVIPSFKRVKMTREMPVPLQNIRCEEDPDFDIPGGWRAIISDGVVTIQAAPENMDMACRRIAALDLDHAGPLPGGVIEDWPDFPYRGLMIDIARNYQEPEEILRVLDLMAHYGLNTFHFHFTDDEAWRLEIPGLPELTEVGSRRGYTTDETDYLMQIFAGDGNPDSAEGSGNGHWTRDEFIGMLRHADDLGIRVIPEVESPGHARAAIKAMEARYRRTGDDTYRLIDPADTSVYTSAQSFHDNVMNPALPGPVRFMTKVARELKAMYAEAGVEMPALHIGGDEVAKGAWTGSPVARKYMESVGMTDERLLHLKFVDELLDSLTVLDIPISGWQEVAVGHNEAYNERVRPHIASVNCWSTLGAQNSTPALSARAGFPTVLSNVDHFYMDLSYTPHPYERGLSWGGYVDEFASLNGYPHELCPVDSADFANVIGVSGQLFSETIRSASMLESYLLPKMLGLAERAWNADTTYTDRQFNSVIVNREMTRWILLNHHYHLAQPGVKIVDGRMMMNTRYGDDFPYVEIRYTTDGTEPTASSTLYTGETDAPAAGEVRAAVFNYDGRRSVTTILYVK